MSVPAIRTEGLTTSYGERRGIVEVDLTVEAGQVFGFLGPNGAGKTTLIRTLLDLLRPSEGRAELLGLDAHHDSLELRGRITYLPGDLALYPQLTAGEQLRWLGRLQGALDEGRLTGLAERFGLDLDRRVGELSSGNRQKVGLIQAFMFDAELLILDEPTSGLDPLMQHEFQQLVGEVAARGRTVFLSSHVLDEVQHATDRVGIIREGRLIAVESVHALQSRSVRHVSVEFDGSAPIDDLRALDGVHDLDVQRGMVRFRLDGRFDPLLALLGRHPVRDLLVEPADLDEIFLAYYSDSEPS